MEFSQWLQGGPFLEVSFLLELKETKKQTIQNIIDRLSKISYKIEIVDKNINEMIDLFVNGYPNDEENPQTHYIHALHLRLYVHLRGKRKATLQIEKISSNTIMVNFWFYSSNVDALEWEQIGIKNEEINDFANFLIELYDVYDFIIGGFAIEENVRALFNCDEASPNEGYRFENVDIEYFLKEPSYFINILWNEKYKKLSDIPLSYKKIDKEGIIIKLKDHYDEFN